MSWTTDISNHGSPLSGEETNSKGNIVGSGVLKRGPWTPEEDAILIDYVQKHGKGNWNAVQKFSGLSRCGKSCRLRWANHLQPDLKKGPITPEEEDTILRLHAKLGNKWAQIATQLPGRTDNEIKNFFHTRKKRLQRAGLKLYPDDILIQNQSNESQQSSVSGTLSGELYSSYSLMEAGVLSIPVFKIESSLCSELYSSMFIGSNMLPEDLIPSCGTHYPAPTMNFQKRPRESDASPCLNDTATSPLITQWNSNAQFQHQQAYELPALPESFCSDNSSLQVLHGSHAFINGTDSTSSPNLGSVRLELPSLQSSDSNYSFPDPTISPIPSVKCTDTLLQSPQAMPSQSYGKPDTDDLLESLVWPSKRVVTSKVATVPLDKGKTGDRDTPLHDASEPDWEALPNCIPPLGSSTEDIFSDLLTGLPFDELQQTDDMLVLAAQANTSYAMPNMPPTSIASSDPNQNGDSHLLDSWTPDTWLNANLLIPDSDQGTEYLVLQEAISALRGG